jgi:TetR/AcrR family transcriptional regulator, mexJK operon transcriptional repressor
VWTVNGCDLVARSGKNVSAANAPDEVVAGRSARKRQAVLAAATELFLKHGFLGTTMDDIAGRAGVSKPTAYNHFPSKEALFIEIVTGMTDAASDAVHNATPKRADGAELDTFLQDYAYRQLKVVLTPRLMQLRRVVIGEVGRFPELGRKLFEAGPRRAMAAFAAMLADLADQGLLAVEEPAIAASDFNWLVMSEPLNRAMLLGDDAIPGQAQLRRYAERGVRIFLAAYGKPQIKGSTSGDRPPTAASRRRASR